MSETLAVVDFDRTLARTPVLAEAYGQAVSRGGHLTADQLANVRHLAEETGRSFDPYEYVRNLDGITEEQLAGITEDFYQLTSPSGTFGSQALYEDALPFLSDLSRLRVPTLIMTSGNPQWQAMKLRATNLDVLPHLITPRKDKGVIIASWRDEETGMYRIDSEEIRNRRLWAGGLTVRHIMLADDKADSFKGLPPDAEGNLIKRSGEAELLSQMGEVGPGVRVVASLAEIDLSAYGERAA